VNCCVDPILNVADEGDTAILANAFVLTVTVEVEEADPPEPIAVAV